MKPKITPLLAGGGKGRLQTQVWRRHVGHASQTGVPVFRLLNPGGVDIPCRQIGAGAESGAM
jgi:hypothetical protein